MPTENRNIFIGVCYHRQAPLLKNNHFQPIHVGKQQSSAIIDHSIGDDTGLNISSKNKAWCELTALYWMRHNVDADYVGLMHYRRILDFSNQANRARNFHEITEKEVTKFGWTETEIEREIAGWDIVTSEYYNVHPVGAGHRNMTNHEFYAHQHHIEDLDRVGEIIKEHHPDVYPFYVQTMTARQMFFGNITIMKKQFFHDYCDFLFDVLERAEATSDITGYDPYQSRIWGFLAERLTNVYLAYARTMKQAKTKTLPVVYGIHPRPRISAKDCRDIAVRKLKQNENRAPRSSQQDVNVVMAFDNGYAAHGATTIMSVLKTSLAPEKLHFNILCAASLSDDQRLKLSEFVTSHNAAITFHDIDERRLSWLPLNRCYISLATYYRPLITELLPNNVDKAIYLDADVICVEPIENLYAIELGDNVAGGAPDEGGVLQSRRLRLPVEQKYVNAGILLLNLQELRKVDIKSEVIETIRQYGDMITLQDQDLLNIIFSGRIKVLPLKWNIGVRAVLENELEPAYRPEDAFAAIQDPGIIHFTDRIKPWSKKSRSPYTQLYYHFRQMTPWRFSWHRLLNRNIQFWIRKNFLATERRFNASIRQPVPVSAAVNEAIQAPTKEQRA